MDAGTAAADEARSSLERMSIMAGQPGVPIRRASLSAEMSCGEGMRRPVFKLGRDTSACCLMG